MPSIDKIQIETKENMIDLDRIPEDIKNIISDLQKAGYLAYAVGGCVRDSIIGRVPKDWDITTSARPEEVIKIFPDSVYENKFGTVGVKIRGENNITSIVEITTFRKEGQYSDFRRPDEVQFSNSIEDDLSRRDFTINAMAMDAKGNIIDLFEGQEDIKNKIIKTVGNPKERFGEDALRMIRAVRLASELQFNIDTKTFSAIIDNINLLSYIAKERIRDEFVKIIMSDDSGPAWGITQMEKTGMLRYVIPELLDGIGVSQNKHHIYTVWEHNLRALDYVAKIKASLEVRLASLLHDIGKPASKRGEGQDATFHAHEMIGAKMTQKIMERLKFSKSIIDKVTLLVRHHLFYYNVGEVTESGVRRFISRVGEENIDDLFKIREADRIGSGVPKAVPYKTRHLRFMIDKVKRDPISPKMLKINGTSIMEHLKIPASPKLGMILSILLEEVLDDPNINNEAILLSRAKDLNSIQEAELKDMAKKAKNTKIEFEAEEEEDMRQRHKV